MLDFTVELFDIKDPWVAIDGTGHSSDQASLYYARKIKKQNKKWRKSYTKNQIAIDTKTRGYNSSKSRSRTQTRLQRRNINHKKNKEIQTCWL